MKLKTQENIKKLEFSAIGISFFAYAALKWGYAIKNKDFSQFYQMDASRLILDIPLDIFLLDFLTTSRRKRKTQEYLQIKDLYDEVVSNISDLMKELHIEDDPVKVFAVYEFLYQNGYLSYGKDNNYNMNIKDFSGMQGVDVINGNGVCRSYAALLTDIYRNLGFESYNLTVHTDSECIEHADGLGNYPIREKDEKTKKAVSIIMGLTKNLKLSNHLINVVKDKDNVLVLDPTNDAFLQKEEGSRLSLANNSEYCMNMDKFYGTVNKVAGIYNHMETSSKIRSILDNSTISYEEYKDRYLSALALCEKCRSRFELFYIENKDLYEEIHKELDTKNNVLKRLIPIYKK